MTGAAGFIGSHLVHTLLSLGQTVVGLDNLSTGSLTNLEAVERELSPALWKNFRFVRGDILDPAALAQTLAGSDVLLHQAAVSSVQKALDEPVETFTANTTGFLQTLVSAKAAGVKKVVYASSAAIYGNTSGEPITESQPAQPISLYGVTKLTDEKIASLFCDRMEITGLRYFNVYGPRQAPNSPYAGVISIFLRAASAGQEITVYGDGSTTRDFVAVADVVQANVLAALGGKNKVFNVGTGKPISLNNVLEDIRSCQPERAFPAVSYRPFREGDIRHSCADIGLISRELGYRPLVAFHEGVEALARSVGQP